jgi:hypothetical protein
MLFTEETVTYLAALYAELKAYRAKRERAAALLADDPDSTYRQAILKDWDYNIDVKLKQIAAEEARHAQSH